MTNLILFGPPGSGKGTQAEKLVAKYNLVHISTGDLFRYEIGNNTPLGTKAKEYMAKGELVPDEVTIGMLKNKVDAHPDAPGFIFDGFPRNIAQANALDALLAEKNMTISKLVSLDVPENEVVTRILKRGETSGRPDDKDPEIARKRFQVYLNETTPVADFYAKKDKTASINGVGEIETIFNLICNQIEINASK
jgi:adenylate kinase